MVIDKNVAEVVKNFLENYAEVHGLPSPGRNVNRITQSLIFLPAINQSIAIFLQVLNEIAC